MACWQNGSRRPVMCSHAGPVYRLQGLAKPAAESEVQQLCGLRIGMTGVTLPLLVPDGVLVWLAARLQHLQGCGSGQTCPHATSPRPCPSLNSCDLRTSCLQLFISPMGAGEVTDLDYLAIMCGCMVVKARGRGFAALPDLFKHEETGAAVNPDWSNLRSTITALLQVLPLLTQQPCQRLTLETPYWAADPPTGAACTRRCPLWPLH